MNEFRDGYLANSSSESVESDFVKRNTESSGGFECKFDRTPDQVLRELASRENAVEYLNG